MNFLLSLILAVSFAHNDDSGDESFVRDIQFINSLSGHSQNSCFGAKELAEEVAQEQKLKGQLCSTLDIYAKEPSSKKLKFDGSDVKNICADYWEGGRSPFLGKKEKALIFAKGTISTVGVEYKPPTRKEVIEMGFKVGTQEQIDDLVEQAQSQVAEVANHCCGGDEMCKTAMSKVKIAVCGDMAANADSSKTDGCFAKRTSYYSGVDTNEAHRALGLLLGDAVKDYDKLDYERAYGASPASTALQFKLLGAEKATVPSSGMVVMSPYFVAGKAYSTYNLTHELGHACSFIRKQSLVLQEDKEAKRAAEAIVRASIDGECSLNYSVEVAYQKILTPLDKNGDFSSCMLDMTKASTVESSTVYSPEACPIKKMEEATASAISLSLDVKRGKIVPNLYPGKFCGGSPSNVHPHNSELAKCLFLKSPKLLATAQDNLNCKGKK